MRQPEDITHNGRTLRAILDDHAEWLWSVGERGQRADLANANLSGANLSGADLALANLTDADLTLVNLAGANLTGANLTLVNLTDANLTGANLTDANLADADLADANFTRVDLNGTRGNMREVKTAHFDTWPIAWTTAPDGVVTLQIGCQRHPLDKWEASDPRWISAMSIDATDWWGRYRDAVLAIVQASPAVQHRGPK